jgi:hypothetical protein
VGVLVSGYGLGDTDHIDRGCVISLEQAGVNGVVGDRGRCMRVADELLGTSRSFTKRGTRKDMYERGVYEDTEHTPPASSALC